MLITYFMEHPSCHIQHGDEGDHTEANEVEAEADKVVDAKVDAEPKHFMPFLAVSDFHRKASLKQGKACQFHDEADVGTYVQESFNTND